MYLQRIRMTVRNAIRKQTNYWIERMRLKRITKNFNILNELVARPFRRFNIRLSIFFLDPDPVLA